MEKSKKAVENRKTVSPSLEVAQRGVNTGNDFASLMSNLMTDILSGKVSPQMANAVCNAGGKLLKVVELQYQYGTPSTAAPLNLVTPSK